MNAPIFLALAACGIALCRAEYSLQDYIYSLGVEEKNYNGAEDCPSIQEGDIIMGRQACYSGGCPPSNDQASTGRTTDNLDASVVYGTDGRSCYLKGELVKIKVEKGDDGNNGPNGARIDDFYALFRASASVMEDSDCCGAYVYNNFVLCPNMVYAAETSDEFEAYWQAPMSAEESPSETPVITVTISPGLNSGSEVDDDANQSPAYGVYLVDVNVDGDLCDESAATATFSDMGASVRGSFTFVGTTTTVEADIRGFEQCASGCTWEINEFPLSEIGQCDSLGSTLFSGTLKNDNSDLQSAITLGSTVTITGSGDNNIAGRSVTFRRDDTNEAFVCANILPNGYVTTLTATFESALSGTASFTQETNNPDSDTIVLVDVSGTSNTNYGIEVRAGQCGETSSPSADFDVLNDISFSADEPHLHHSSGLDLSKMSSLSVAILDGDNEVACANLDQDECELGIDECSSRAICENTEGSYTCTCRDLYSGDGFTCDKIPFSPPPVKKSKGWLIFLIIIIIIGGAAGTFYMKKNDMACFAQENALGGIKMKKTSTAKGGSKRINLMSNQMVQGLSARKQDEENPDAENLVM